VRAPSEWELVLRCRAGSTAAYGLLVERYQDRALALAGALLQDADDAADAVQEAFIRAYRTLGRLREGSAFGPWFMAILRNHCLDRLRGPNRRRARWEAGELDRERWSEPSAPATLEREALAAAVRDALGALSPEHRTVLVLKELEGLSYAQIAETLGIQPGTVASRLHHARAALRKVLNDRGITLEEDVP